jgi:hypothetical protein
MSYCRPHDGVTAHTSPISSSTVNLCTYLFPPKTLNLQSPAQMFRARALCALRWLVASALSLNVKGAKSNVLCQLQNEMKDKKDGSNPTEGRKLIKKRVSLLKYRNTYLNSIRRLLLCANVYHYVSASYMHYYYFQLFQNSRSVDSKLFLFPNKSKSKL